MNRHVIVISEDAMVFEDLKTLQTLPNFGKIWHRTARVNCVRSVYPTITYPCHASMMTGVYPDRHGVVNNEQPILCCKQAPWLHFRGAVKAPTIFDYAKAKGLTTAAVFWPVTGNDPSIDYLVDEYWPQSAAETTRECFRNSGSSDEVMERVVDPNVHLLENRN
ncbi:MAG TPA: alkaline phosphatase family protein, partial [Clostridia bacterium]|nr:alkaline phosphatase family protein [Clostridia bacterium]